MNDSAKSTGGEASENFEPVEETRRQLPYSAVRLLADEVVVHLAQRFRGDARAPTRAQIDVELFTDCLLHGTFDDAMELIHQERRAGQSVESIYLHTLAGSARLMGQMWEEDRLSFLHMTVATGRIFSMLRNLRSLLPMPRPVIENGHMALLLAVPGETHTLGITMAADIFRSRGWQITLRTGLNHDDLIRSIENEHHRVVGISASHPDSIVPLTRLIIAMRIMQPWAYLIVGGRIVETLPDLKDLIGVDALMSHEEDPEILFDSFIDLPPRDER